MQAELSEISEMNANNKTELYTYNIFAIFTNHTITASLVMLSSINVCPKVLKVMGVT